MAHPATAQRKTPNSSKNLDNTTEMTSYVAGSSATTSVNVVSQKKPGRLTPIKSPAGKRMLRTHLLMNGRQLESFEMSSMESLGSESSETRSFNGVKAAKATSIESKVQDDEEELLLLTQSKVTMKSLIVQGHVQVVMMSGKPPSVASHATPV